MTIATGHGGASASEHPMSFEEFFDQEFARVLAVVFALVGDGLVAEELTQEAFARAVQRWETVGTYARPGAWVRTVAVNLAYSRFRRLGIERRAQSRLQERDHVEFPEPVDPAFTEVWRHVRELPRRQTIAVILRYVEDLSIAEVAEAMGCAEATVRVHLHRARRTLARVFEDSAERIIHG